LSLGYFHRDLLVYQTEPRTVQETTPWWPVDIGPISLPPSERHPDADSYIYIVVEAWGNGAADFSIYDLVLIPADELLYSAYCDPAYAEWGIGACDSADGPTWLDVDGLLLPKHSPRALCDSPVGVRAPWVYDAAGPPALAPGTTQRLWWLGSRHDETVPCWDSQPWVLRRVQLEDNDSYLLARGAE
jgi:hypothetical protein